MPPELPGAIDPDWGVDPGRVGALASTRAGGVSQGVYASLNLGAAVGDDPRAVAENRRRFETALGVPAHWLVQVHGARVLHLRPGEPVPAEPADAAIATEPGVACTVAVADCLPVLFAAPRGRGVGAAHAGWRGLAGGVLEATVDALCAAAGCAPGDLVAWLGPCIGPRHFEVGADVLAAFGARLDAPGDRFVARARVDGSRAWRADLASLARDRLQARGVARISGGSWCTVEDASRFFSFRRDRVTGRMAAAVWLR
ncbi:MAG TPA: peptidoglycan editing factor PgeF [Burkholderiaceae bacterium]|nr:peptidoglycan editing factor PgeF [Burkholderiaceae bacterium]